MTDIVDRLRREAVRFNEMDAAGDQPWVADAAWAADNFSAAADEIERLRRERDRLAADLATAHKDALAWMQKANQQAGKVSVTRELVESVLEDAETWVKANYIVGDGPHPAMAHRFRRDMADILALRAELQEARDA